jgi:hypothetical protein
VYGGNRAVLFEKGAAAAAAVPRTDNQALSSSSRTNAFADDSGIRAKNDVPKNRRHTVITIIEAMMCEVPHLC